MVRTKSQILIKATVKFKKERIEILESNILDSLKEIEKTKKTIGELNYLDSRDKQVLEAHIISRKGYINICMDKIIRIEKEEIKNENSITE